MTTRSGPLRFAILASGSGSNAEAILRACQAGLSAEPVALLSNNPGAYALSRAREHGVPAVVVDHRRFGRREDHERQIIEQLDERGAQALVLAGYMRIVTSTLIDHYKGRYVQELPGVINIHPADTAAYQGAHGYEFALGLTEGSTRLTETKITVHFVDAGVDTGPVIAQRTVPIREDDTIDDLRARGLAVEHELYPECVQLFADRRLELSGREVRPQGAPS